VFVVSTSVVGGIVVVCGDIECGVTAVGGANF